MSLRLRLEKIWYSGHPLALLLAPLGWLYLLAQACRRFLYARGILPVTRLGVPVIVVGNLTVGGTGKTPLVIWLARRLQARSYRPGIVSRGYGGAASAYASALRVEADSDPALVGDEPVLLAQRTGCPVMVGPKRVHAAQALLRQTDCNIVLCDDGLQHSALARDMEIVVVDGVRRFGNGRCLPAGPLREPRARLNTVDLVVANGRAAAGEYLMDYTELPVQSLDGSRSRALGCFRQQRVHAVAALGNPERFFTLLRRNGIDIEAHAFPDHQGFRRAELEFGDGAAILMTEKDAVKCRRLRLDNAWYVPIDATLSLAFEQKFIQLVENINHG